MLEESLHCGEWAFKVSYGESSDRKKGESRESLNLLRQYLIYPEQNVGKNVDRKGHSDKVSKRSKEHIFGQ